ncbi:MAG: hydrolase [Gammaproteobacteria bacterium]|nr:hydrolase [Gammaproteobacteria bacterium]
MVRRRPRLGLRRERVELPDGDFLDLDWVAPAAGPAGSRGADPERVDVSARGAWGGTGRARPAERAPVVLVLHGLEGSSDSHYARGLLAAVRDRGWTGVLMHFRGCSGEPNRLPRSYHSGETGDTAYVVSLLRGRLPGRPLAVVGYSLGGNVLLKWLGETGSAATVDCAVAVSVPFELSAAANRLERGFSRFYQWWLLRSLADALEEKVARGTLPPAFAGHARSRTFRAFDDAVTAPLHGFAGVDDYYGRSSSRQYLGGIAVPTLILHALDDPFLVPAAVPVPSEVPSAVTLEVYPRGGHVGFVAGRWPWRAEYWLERRIPAFLAARAPTSPASPL